MITEFHFVDSVLFGQAIRAVVFGICINIFLAKMSHPLLEKFARSPTVVDKYCSYMYYIVLNGPTSPRNRSHVDGSGKVGSRVAYNSWRPFPFLFYSVP